MKRKKAQSVLIVGLVLNIVFASIVFNTSRLSAQEALCNEKHLRDLKVAVINCTGEQQCTLANNTSTETGKVYLIGDSIAAGAKSQIEGALSTKGFSPVVNATASRNLTTGSSDLNGLGVLERDKSQYSDAKVIVIELGTNSSGFNDSGIKQAIDTIRSVNTNAKIYWVNVGADNNKRNGSDINTAALDGVLRRNESFGYTIIDWRTAVEQNPDFIDGSDGLGVHLSSSGRDGFATTISTALTGSTGTQDISGCQCSTELPAATYGTNLADGGPGSIQKISPAPFTGQPITPTGIVLHWTGGSPNQSVESFIAGISGRGLSVQLYIDGSGRVYQLVDNLATLTSHASGANSKTIGIEIAAGSDGTVASAEREINANAAQKQAVIKTVAYLIKTYNMQADPDIGGFKGILSHHLVSPGRKSDVGDRYHADILNAIRNGGELAVGTSLSNCGSILGSDNGLDPDGNKALGQRMASEAGFTGSEWACLLDLWTRESGWKTNAINDAERNNDLNRNRVLDNGETISDTEHDAYGIPQALPGGKMASAGADWRTNPATQIKWGLDYIKDRYRTPCGAIAHHDAKNWY